MPHYVVRYWLVGHRFTRSILPGELEDQLLWLWGLGATETVVEFGSPESW
jgi:hypothetical protein